MEARSSAVTSTVVKMSGSSGKYLSYENRASSKSGFGRLFALQYETRAFLVLFPICPSIVVGEKLRLSKQTCRASMARKAVFIS